MPVSKAAAAKDAGNQGRASAGFALSPRSEPRVPGQPAQAGCPEEVVQKSQPDRRDLVDDRDQPGWKPEAEQRRDDKAERNTSSATRSAENHGRAGASQNSIQV